MNAYTTHTVYDNAKGETFTRETDTYGYTDKYDVERKTKKELDDWLVKNGFTFVGFENAR